ncbi:MAG: hypothetical protein PHE81_00525 [Atribacterota bacterium]|nr:hypothetical protein [Atribacterota bacterium]
MVKYWSEIRGIKSLAVNHGMVYIKQNRGQYPIYFPGHGRKLSPVIEYSIVNVDRQYFHKLPQVFRSNLCLRLWLPVVVVFLEAIL